MRDGGTKSPFATSWSGWARRRRSWRPRLSQGRLFRSADRRDRVAAAARRSPWGPVEVLALLLMTVGAVFLPFVGPLTGLVLAWTSPNWTTREKAIATGIVLVLLILPLLILFGDFGVSPSMAPIT